MFINSFLNVHGRKRDINAHSIKTRLFVPRIYRTYQSCCVSITHQYVVFVRASRISISLGHAKGFLLGNVMVLFVNMWKIIDMVASRSKNFLHSSGTDFWRQHVVNWNDMSLNSGSDVGQRGQHHTVCRKGKEG